MRNLVVLLLPVILLYSCVNRSGEEKLQKMNFEIDSTLVGHEVQLQNTGITFLIPAEWSQGSHLKQDSLKDLIIPADTSFRYELNPVKVFFEKDNKVLMIVSMINDLTDAELKFLAKNYRRIFNFNLHWERVRHEGFRHHDFIVHQFLLQKKETIHFRLIFTDAKLTKFQVDYIIPADVYREYIKIIESSIGSFKAT
ncbi:MAG: hypothetical protein K9I94_10800 [Bacteroidales bacterium]|nr:hypothetical protein [Bacteroidales bacterium]